MYIKDIASRDDLFLILDSQEVNDILSNIGLSQLEGEYGCLFVSIQDGEYTEVYGCERSIPYLNESLDELLNR